VDVQFAARRASQADTERVLAIIAAAFTADPLWSHALALPDGSTSHHAQFWRPFVAGTLPLGWTWLTGGAEATAIWVPPGAVEMTPEQEQQLLDLAAARLGPRADAYAELLHRFETARPQEPHYYLSLLGTDPSHRGKGLGMRLLAHTLELVDAEHLPAYLESTNPANNRRYAGVGFEPLGEFGYPGGGPVVTTMWRAAR
jgi:GNAT superfamily N-acetyltransferase